METIKAYVASGPGEALKPFQYQVGSLGPEEVDIKVHYCGICHSDLSMIDNEWQMSNFPFVPGHEVVGEIVQVGDVITHLKPGDIVGLGWCAKSCMRCDACLSGHHNLCSSAEQTMIGRYGGFADRVRCHWSWAIPLPPGLPAQASGPLFCGGITVFGPILQFGVLPIHRVGVVGIGGLGHMALQFLNKWGCHVTAFSSTLSKSEEARRFGAHEVVASNDDKALESLAYSFDFILVTANVPLNWGLYINALKPNGRLHFVGAVPLPLNISVFSLLVGQKSISSSPLGSPVRVRQMLEFSSRHKIAPQVELFPMSKVNEALAHLKSGKARYRIVLKSDF